MGTITAIRTAIMKTAELLEMSETDQRRRGLLPRSIEKRQGSLVSFARWLGQRGLLEATRADVEAFLDARQIGARTRYAWLSHLHGFYRWAVAEDLMAEDPTAKITRPKLRRSLPRPVSTNELRTALDAASARQRCWLLLAAYQGLRCQEIAGLRREDVLDSEGLLRVTHAKGGNERLLPLHPEVLTSLVEMPMPRIGWVFTRPRGGKYTPAQVSEEFNVFLRAVGSTATAHQLRHWFGTELYKTTHDLRLTQEMLGHANPSTTAVYTAFDRRAAGEAVRALAMEPPVPEDGPDPEEAA